MSKGNPKPDEDLGEPSDPNIGYRVEVKNVPLYFGNLEDEIEEWFCTIERIALANGWKLNFLAKLVPAYLRSKAAEAWESLPIETQQDYIEMKSAIISKFTQRGISNKFSTLLRNRKQGKDENVLEYGRSIHTLVRKSYPEMDMKGKEQVALDCLKNGLRPEIRRFVVTANPKNFDDAVAIASEQMCYASFENSEERNPYSFTIAAAELDNAGADERIDRLEKLMTQMMAQQNNVLESIRFQIGRSETPPPRLISRNNFAGKSPYENANRTRFATSGAPICDFCNRRGHVKLNCRQRLNMIGNRQRSASPTSRNTQWREPFRQPAGTFNSFRPNPTPRRVRFQQQTQGNGQPGRNFRSTNYTSIGPDNEKDSVNGVLSRTNEKQDPSNFRSQKTEYGNYQQELESLRTQNERLAERLLDNGHNTNPKTTWSPLNSGNMAFMMEVDEPDLIVTRESAASTTAGTDEVAELTAALMELKGLQETGHKRPRATSAPHQTEKEEKLTEIRDRSTDEPPGSSNYSVQARGTDFEAREEASEPGRIAVREDSDNRTVIYQESRDFQEIPSDIEDRTVEDIMADTEMQSILRIADTIREFGFISSAEEDTARRVAAEEPDVIMDLDSMDYTPILQPRNVSVGEYLAVISCIRGQNQFDAYLVKDLRKVKNFSVLSQLDGLRTASNLLRDGEPGERMWIIWYPLCWRAKLTEGGRVECSLDLIHAWDRMTSSREYYAVNIALDYTLFHTTKRAIICQLERDCHILRDMENEWPDPIGRLIHVSISYSHNGVHFAKIIANAKPSYEAIPVWPYRCLECLSVNVWPELKISKQWDQMRKGFCLKCESPQPFRQVALEQTMESKPFVQDHFAASQLQRTESLPKDMAFSAPPVEEVGRKEDIWPFFGTYNIFSNMYKTPITIEGQEYNSNEQYYTYKKAMWIPDIVAAETIMEMTDPKEMKRLARDLFSAYLSQPEIDMWREDGHAILAMWEANWAKYNQNSDFREALLETGDKLIVEASHDRYWGSGCAFDDDNLYLPHLWKRKNEMGQLLMRIRAAIRRHQSTSELECNYVSKGNKMPLVIGRIGEKQPVEFLVDSGCNVSLIKLVVLKRDTAYRNWEPQKKDVRQTARSITGGLMELLGQVEVNIHLGDEDRTHNLYVVESAPYDAVLGTDFMTSHRVTLDLGLGQMYIGESALKLWASEESPGEKVFLQSSVNIPPWSEVIAQAYLESRNTIQGLVEPRRDLSQIYSVEVANELVKPVHGKIPIRFANLTSCPIFLHDTLHIAGYAPVISIQSTGGQPLCYSAEQCPEGQEDEQHAHLKSIDLSNTDLTEFQKRQLVQLLEDNEDVFSKGGYDVGHTTLVQHTINTGDTEPIKQRPYRIPEALKEDVHRQLHEMEEKGIIRPSASPWCAPMVIVKKKTGENRLCVDYRKLNAISKADVFPLPRIDGILDKLGNAAYFSSLDLASGYYQIEVADEDKEKTAFSTGEELFEFTVMPFGLKSAPATFQRLMQFMLTGLPSCFVYIDDILVASTAGFGNHLAELSKVFDRLRQGNLKLKPSKCAFAVRKVAFLGHVVSSEGVAPNPDKINAIVDFDRPSDARSVKRFLGTCSYFRSFVEGFSVIGAPLFNLLKKNAPFIWTPECEEAFSELKKRLVEHPILIYPDFSQSFRLHTDASDLGLGAILTQMRDGKDHAIAYASRTLVPAEKNYSVTEKEALAVVWGVSHFRHYLYGHNFTVITDHQALRWLMGIKNPVGRLARWSLTLQEYDFDIIYRPGKTNCADGLSRHPIEKASDASAEINATERESEEEPSENSPGIEIATEPVDGPQAVHDLVKQEQRKDPVLNEMIAYLETGESDRTGPDIERLQDKATSYVLKNGFLYHIWEDTSKSRRPQIYQQLVVPSDMIPEIVESCHDDVFSGHLGLDRTYYKIRQRFYFDKMYDIIRNWCQSCTSCQTRKAPSKYHHEPMRPIKSTKPFDICVVDCLGPLPNTESGNKYVVIFQDHFTKWPEAFATTNIQAVTVAKLFVGEIVCRHSAPTALLSDRGPCFISAIVQSVCELVNTRKIYATAYRPQTQGLVERMNRTLTEMLSQYVSSNQKDWDSSLNFVLFAYRTSIQETIQMEPFYLLYGRMPTFPIEAMLSPKLDENTEPSQYIINLRKRITSASRIARKNIAAGQEKQKAQRDKRTSIREFKKGDKVWLKRAAIPRNLNKKLTHKWTGLHEVQEVYGDGNLLLKAVRGGKMQLVHAERCKLAMPADLRVVSEDLLAPADETLAENVREIRETQEEWTGTVTGDGPEQDDTEFLPTVEETDIARAVLPVEVTPQMDTELAEQPYGEVETEEQEEANGNKQEAAPRAGGTAWQGRLRNRSQPTTFALYLMSLLLLVFRCVFAASDHANQTALQSLEVTTAPGIRLNSAYGVLFQDAGLLDNAHDYLQHAFVIPYKLELDHPTKITICDDNVTASNHRTTFQKEFGLADHTNQLISDLCKLVKLVNDRTYIGFRSMNARVGFIANDLKLLSSSVRRPNHRNKRNILSGLWCLLESLFGSCKNDGVDAKTLRSAMRKMEQRFDRTSVEIDNVSKKVISFAKMSMAGFRNIDYRFNEVNQESLAIQDAQQKIVQNVKMLTGTLDRTLLAIKVQTNLVLQYAYLSTRMREWQAQQEGAHLILQGLAFMSNGQLSPEIVPPHSLIKLLRSIQKKLKGHGVQLAYTPARIDQYYHLHLVRSIQISDGHIVINTRIPVARSDSLYQLWKVIFTSLPGPNGSYLRIDSQHDVLAVGQGTSQYISISRKQLDTCGHHRQKSCPFVFPSVPVSSPSCLWALWKKSSHAEVAQYCDVVIERRQHPVRSFDLGRGLWFITDVSGDWRLFCSKKSPVSVKSCSHCIISLPCGCGLSTPSINLPMRFYDCPHPRYTIQLDYNPFLYPNITVGSGFNLTAEVTNPTLWTPISRYFNHSLAPQTELMVNFSRYIKWTEEGRQEFLTVDQQLSEKVDESIEHIKQVQNLGQWKFYGLLCGELLLGLIVLFLLLKDYLQGFMGAVTTGSINHGSYRVTYKRRPSANHEDAKHAPSGEHPLTSALGTDCTTLLSHGPSKLIPPQLDAQVPETISPTTSPREQKLSREDLEYAEIGTMAKDPDYVNWTTGLKDHKGIK